MFMHSSASRVVHSHMVGSDAARLLEKPAAEYSRVQKFINLMTEWVLKGIMKKLTSGLIELTTFIMLEIAAMRWIFASFCLCRQRWFICCDWICDVSFVLGWVFRICGWYLLPPQSSSSSSSSSTSADIDELPVRDWLVVWTQTTETL